MDKSEERLLIQGVEIMAMSNYKETSYNFVMTHEIRWEIH